MEVSETLLDWYKLSINPKKFSETLEDCIMGFYPIPMRTFEFSIKFIHEAKPEVVCMSTPLPLR